MKNKCGVTEWYLPVSGPSAIKLCKKLGLDGIQIGDLGGHLTNYPMLDPRIKDMYMEELADSDFEIYSYHAVDLSRDVGFYSDVNSERGKLSFEIFKKSIEICHEYGIPVIMLGCFMNAKPGNKFEVAGMVKNLKEFVKIAEDGGVRLALESFLDIHETIRILEEVDGLTLCYDLLNPIKFGFGEPSEDLTLLKRSHIDHLHVKDAPEDMADFSLFGAGCADIPGSMDLLKAMDYEGWFFLENHYNEPTMYNDGHGLDAILEDIKRLKAMW